jgi:hypothetical protein
VVPATYPIGSVVNTESPAAALQVQALNDHVAWENHHFILLLCPEVRYYITVIEWPVILFFNF